MTYWRMQLHPAESDGAIRHAVKSLAANFIGLDFTSDVGDLRVVDFSTLPEGQKDYWAFAHEMLPGDEVLIVVHHFPFALVTVEGDYTYVSHPVPEIGVWFRHFRRVTNIRYYADRVTNARTWEPITMTDAISPLRTPDSKSLKLIEAWTRES